MKDKSITCKKKNGKPLFQYDWEWEAQEDADYKNNRYGSNLIPRTCDNCKYWHLIAGELMVNGQKIESIWCKYCNKYLFYTKEEAEAMVVHVLSTKKQQQKVYRCEKRPPKLFQGWHLTSQK